LNKGKRETQPKAAWCEKGEYRRVCAQISFDEVYNLETNYTNPCLGFS
jgi:hypothetical protein